MTNNKIENVNTYIKIGIIMMLVPILLAIFAPFLTNFDTSTVDPVNRLQAVSSKYLMGTDDIGRDVFTRTIYGTRISLFIGVAVTFISLLSGMVVGILSAYYRAAGSVLMRIVDGIMAYPTIILAIAMAGVLGSGVMNIIIALSISYFPMFARITRNLVQVVKSSEYVESAVVIGKSDLYIITNCILPNILSPLIVQTTFTFAMAILNESILSFLGVGIQVPMPSLGGMVNDGRNYLMVAPWTVIFPGLMISWIVLSMNMIGDGLRDQLDPKNR